jgi:hypothetical protein
MEAFKRSYLIPYAIATCKTCKSYILVTLISVLYNLISSTFPSYFLLNIQTLLSISN